MALGPDPYPFKVRTKTEYIITFFMSGIVGHILAPVKYAKNLVLLFKISSECKLT